MCLFVVFFSSRRRHTRVALVTGVQTCALPISEGDETVDDAPQVFRLRQGGLDLLVLHQGSRQIGEHRLAVADRAVETPAVETVTHLLSPFIPGFAHEADCAAARQVSRSSGVGPARTGGAGCSVT